MSRTAKQTIIIAIYLALIGSIVFGVYWIWFRPIPSCFDHKQNQNETQIDCGGVCMPCELKYPKPLEVVFAKNLPRSTSQSDVFAELKNPNLTVGASEVDYHITLYGHFDEVLGERDGTTFVYPGTSHYVYEPAFAIGATNVGRVDFAITNVIFEPQDKFYFSDLQATGVALEKNNDVVRLTGTARNGSDLTIDNLSVVGILYDGDKQNVLAVSSTLLKTVLSREQRFFEISFPSSLLQFVPLTGKEPFDIELSAPPLQ
ncbi:MAG: hypothetical protein KGI50_01235 [Patescibacteria group bacterium]|nr:hypothetical protein [Patescibacteria group bacterium]MDE2438027.1 hypothetical protein [Patescibacteria group bacterium]